jgi:hypothetical protein
MKNNSQFVEYWIEPEILLGDYDVEISKLYLPLQKQRMPEME